MVMGLLLVHRVRDGYYRGSIWCTLNKVYTNMVEFCSLSICDKAEYPLSINLPLHLMSTLLLLN